MSKSLEYKLRGASRQKDWRIFKAIHNIQAVNKPLRPRGATVDKYSYEGIFFK